MNRQFEGRTAEEAVARARKALGDSDALRCWKTRKGGVGGFFAREVFVASLTPPPGSETTRGKGSQKPARSTGERRAPRSVSDGSARSHDAASAGLPQPGGSAEPEDHLSGLVEATADQLSLRSLAIPAGAFDQVLAEAEAALARLPAVSEPERPDHQPVLPTDVQAELEGSAKGENGAQPPDGHAPAPQPDERDLAVAADRQKRAAKAKARPKAPGPKSVATVPSTERSRGPRLPDLKPGLRSLGVPSSYLPPGRRPSLDLLADAMATLPSASALPTGPGAVVAVVGCGDDLLRTVDLVAGELSLGTRDVLQPGQDAGSLGRQIARRRSSGRRSVLAVHAEPGRLLGQNARSCLEHAAPDYVLAALDAGRKRADVEHLVGELPTVDALALWGLAGTRTPGELLGVTPILFVDGETGSPLSWTLYLAGRAVGWLR